MCCLNHLKNKKLDLFPCVSDMFKAIVQNVIFFQKKTLIPLRQNYVQLHSTEHHCSYNLVANVLQITK